MRSNNDMRSSSSTLSAAPSLTMSKPSLNNSKASLTHSRQSITESNKEPGPPTREEKIAEFLDKAKFYTSLCLGKKGKCIPNFNSSVYSFLFS